MAAIVKNRVEQFVRSSNWSKYLLEQDLARLLEDATIQKVAAGELICRQGEIATQWYGLMSGLLRMDVLGEDGRQTVFTAGAAGTWWGEGTLLRREKRRYEILIVRSAEVACISAATFYWLLENSMNFNHALLAHCNDRMSHFVGLIQRDRSLVPENRIACLLLDLAAQAGKATPPSIRISQDEIAGLIDVSRQRTNRALSALSEHGLIRVSYRRIDIIDADGLLDFHGP